MQSGCFPLLWLNCFDLPAGQHQTGDRSQEREGSGDAQRARKAAAESLGGAEAAGRGKHRRQDRHAERTAKLTEHAESAGSLADVACSHRVDYGILHGGCGQRDATAGDDQRCNELRVGQAGRGDQPDPGYPDRLQEQPAGHQDPFTDPIDENTGQRGNHEQGRGQGQQA